MMKRGIVASLAVLAGVSFGETTCTWTGAWDVEPHEGDAIVIASGDLTWKSPLPMSVASWTQNADYTGTVTFDTGLETFTVTGDVALNGGTWTHTANPSFKNTDEGWRSGRGTKQLIVSCGGDFTLGENAKIDVQDKGFRGAQGPGFGVQDRGASHGGAGVKANASWCYGSPTRPITIGSGGRNYAGGGAVSLTVVGDLVVKGTITADALKQTSADYHAAGGSVLLVANRISCSGTVSALGAYTGGSNAGGGGRIAFKQTGAGDFSGITGTVSAFNGKTTTGAGTIYYETASDEPDHGKLVLSAGGSLAEMSGFGDGRDYEFAEVVLDRGGRIGVGAETSVTARKLVTTSSLLSGITLAGGTLRIGAEDVFTNVAISVSAAGSSLTCGGEGCGATLSNNVVVTMSTGELEFASLKLTSNAKITHSLNGTRDQGYGVRLKVLGDMQMDSGAQINADDLGFNGDGTAEGGGPGEGVVGAAGGSYGGLAINGNPNKVYGSIKRPTDIGSDVEGGKGHGGQGGGRIRLSVGGSLTLNGTVSANGGMWNGGSSSPSGGSVWIDAGSLSGAGKILALGGQTSRQTDPGGGGRVAVYLTEDNATFDAFEQAGGEISAAGGRNQSGDTYTPYGACGTVYLSRTENGITNDVLVIRNRNSALRTSGAVIGPNVKDTDVGSVRIETNGYLRIAQNASLTVRRDWARSTLGKNVFVADASDAENAAGTVTFTDATLVSTVTGTNDFANLVCTTPGKTIKFGTEGSVARIIAGGKLTVAGDETAKVMLRSTSDDANWFLDVRPGGGADVSCADVKDSDAETLGGQKISASDSTNSGNNKGWSFSTIVIGETITWTGAADTSWANPANWDLERLPVATDVVAIPSGCDHQPELAEGVTMDELHLAEGATLTLNGFGLTVAGTFEANGNLVCRGAERIEASGETVTLAGGFTCADSTFVLAGDKVQTFDPHGHAFGGVCFDKTGGALTLADGFTAYQLCANAAMPVTVNFAAGKTVKATDFYVDGAAGGSVANLTFASTEPGTAWILDVARQTRVQGVAVSDSHATNLPIHDDEPAVNGVNNANWIFGGTLCRWIGGASGNFTNAACWADGRVPDETSLVYFDADVTLTLTAPVSVREFQTAAGTVAVAKSTNLLTVVESLSVENGATLSLTSPCQVNNNVIIRKGGTLTHAAITSAPGLVTNRLWLTVGRDMMVEKDAFVDADYKGFTQSFNGGLGYPGVTLRSGPSHGGAGGCGIPAYDSVFAPIHPGSSANSGDVYNDAGGAIRLAIGGTLTLNGRLSANANGGNSFAASGGSIWVTAWDLVGAGTISADGGDYLVSCVNPTSGGRIAVILTEGDFSGWTGTMSAMASEAYGGCNRPSGAPGTIYLQRGDEPDKGGTVYLTGRAQTDGFSANESVRTPFPAEGWDKAEDFAEVKFVVSGRSPVAFKADMRIADIVMTNNGDGKPKAYLFDNEVKVESIEHRRRANGKCKGWCAPYADLVNPGPEGKGAFVWPSLGLKLLVR